MTTEIGIRELKNEASRIVRTVREEMMEYVITVRGEPVALLRPLTEMDERRLRQQAIEMELAEWEALAEAIGASWQSAKTGVELVEEQRRG
jgi:prevent-host-death family protein